MRKHPVRLRVSSLLLIVAAALMIFAAGCTTPGNKQSSQPQPTQEKTAVAAAEKTAQPKTEETAQAEDEKEENCDYVDGIENGKYHFRAPCGNGYFTVYSSSMAGVLYVAVLPVKNTDWMTTEVDVRTIALYGDNEADLAIMHQQVCYYIKGDAEKQILPRTPWSNAETTQYLKDNPCN